MDMTEGINRAIAYLEKNLTEKIDYEQVAKRAYCSSYHFQRVFSALFDMTIGEYLRARRLSCAGEDLLRGEKVLSVALKYAYNSSESFSRAFLRYHGVLPSLAKGARLRYQPPLSCPKFSGDTNNMQEFQIRELQGLVLVGYTKRFTGAPYGEMRLKQEADFFSTTRFHQWLLIGASQEPKIDYCVLDNFSDDGYDFSIAYSLSDWTRQALFDPCISGVRNLEKFGFRTIEIPARTYAVFETPRKKNPIDDYCAIRNAALCDLPKSGYRFENSPEVALYHWRERRRYIEMRLPVEKIR